MFHLGGERKNSAYDNFGEQVNNVPFPPRTFPLKLPLSLPNPGYFHRLTRYRVSLFFLPKGHVVLIKHDSSNQIMQHTGSEIRFEVCHLFQKKSG
jgi:hypothetical protein